MRAKGITKIALVALMDFTLLYSLIGTKWAAIITSIIILTAWLGEYIDVAKDGAISMDKLGYYQRDKLKRSLSMLYDNIENKTGINISGLKVNVLPSDEINAYSYGGKNMAVTSGLLNNCDEFTIGAILAHEVSHTLSADGTFFRAVMINITLVIFAAMVMSFVASSAVWIIFLILSIIGICGGFASVILFSGISKGVKGFFSLLQTGMFFIYKSLSGILSRGCEYRADKYAVEVGYGTQLKYFLQRFSVRPQERSLRNVIYSTHPSSSKRIYRIEKYMQEHRIQKL